jgi:hypothetical protein
MLGTYVLWCMIIHKVSTLAIKALSNTPPHSLKDSNVNPKVETMEEKGVGVHSLVCSILEVEGRVRALGWRLG